jgi:3-oxoacyl-[acyl-carrier protein] reductase
LKLGNRIALITGSGSGFGAAVAFQMAREGAKIGVNDIDDKKIEQTCLNVRKQGAEALALNADVANVDQVKKMFEKIKSHWGTIDILVNNAGLAFRPTWVEYFKLHDAATLKAAEEINKTGKTQESLKITSSFQNEWWHETLNVILNGTFYCTREALKIMEAQRKGKIINMASIIGLSGESNVPAYAAAKGGVIAFTKSVAKEVIGSNIIVNAVAPGFCDTPFLANMSQTIKSNILARIPSGRLGTSKEIASLVVYLASDDSNYIVGQVISPNGGILI